MNIRNLLTVKSIVTLLMVGTFCVLSVADFCYNHSINSAFTTFLGSVIGWYFTRQETKNTENSTDTK